MLTPAIGFLYLAFVALRYDILARTVARAGGGLGNTPAWHAAGRGAQKTLGCAVFLGAKIAVVMPAFNEADKIASAMEAVPGFVDVLIVIDDASRDATAQRAAMAQHHVDVCQIISHARNCGVGASLATGYAHVLASHPDVDVVAVMAGDGQMHGDDLPRLLTPVATGAADYAKGNRFAGGAAWREMPRTRQLGNIVLSLATRAAVGYPVFDSQCGYTAISRHMLRQLPLARLYPRYGYPNDLLGLLAARQARVIDVPVRPIYGQMWRSGISPRAAVHPLPFLLARAAWRARRRRQSPAPRNQTPPAPSPSEAASSRAQRPGGRS